ncbi:hypothetical protein, partial [Escherichia coli]
LGIRDSHRAWRASAFTGICNDLAAASTFV